MRVLISCEYSGRVREAFRRRGHYVKSIDLEPAEDGSPDHIQGDIFEHLADMRRVNFNYDLMIAHPPCTFLCNSGVRWLYRDGVKEVINPEGELNWDKERVREMEEGIAFFQKLETHARELFPMIKIARENPIMHRYARAAIGRPHCIVQPWWFGDKAFKATGFWLTGLPPLVEDPKLTLRAIVPKPKTAEHRKWSQVHQASASKTRWKERSRTYPGIAEAMARTWG